MIEMAKFTPPFPSIVKMIEKMASHYKRKDKRKVNKTVLDGDGDDNAQDGLSDDDDIF